MSKRKWNIPCNVEPQSFEFTPKSIFYRKRSIPTCRFYGMEHPVKRGDTNLH